MKLNGDCATDCPPDAARPQAHDLFALTEPYPIVAGALVMPGHALAQVAMLWAALADILAEAPLRHMQTPGGLAMSVAMTNCGEVGWVSDRRGYRYDPRDPLRDAPWPAMPAAFAALAQAAAAAAGFAHFRPDVCLVNCYRPGARLSLHQDQDERDFSQPIVSVSLGLPARFLFGGPRRRDACVRIPLTHGDVVVWGGPARRHYHGVAPLATGEHPLTGSARYNLTFRQAR